MATIDSELKRAASLVAEECYAGAKQIYVKQADAIMALMKETSDDANF